MIIAKENNMTKLNVISCSNEECAKEFKQRKPTSKYCSVECVKSVRNSKNLLDRICLNKDCQQGFSVQRGSDKKKYCSRSCANSVNNTLSPKRHLENNCFTCQKPVKTIHKYCVECREEFYIENGKNSQRTLFHRSLKRECKICLKIFESKAWNAKYCSKKCLYKKTNYSDRKCKKCEKSISINSKTGFCVKCANENRAEKHLNNWLQTGVIKNVNGSITGTIRTYLLEQANYACEECGFNKPHPVDGKSILEVDHIDGNSENNRRENLRVLCPNCHALTPTYRARNAGKGRTNRYKNKK